jgi:N-acetylneuraminic acid mutarotase
MNREFIILLTSLMLIGLLGTASMSQEAGTWTQKADMPTARYYAGSAVVDGRIYVIGGRDQAKAILSAIEEYDPATDTWTRRADMPTRRATSVIAAVEGIIYVIGGMFGETVQDNRPLSAVEAYDPATDTWTAKADMPTAIFDHAACVIDGRIYVSGGETSCIDIPGPVPFGTLATVQVYDPAADTWTQASDMPGPTADHAASAVDGKMYIIGGSVWPSAFLSPVVYVYDPATDTWTTAADLPTPRWDLTANVVDGKIYAIGGKRGATATVPIFSTVEEFDPGLPVVIPSVSPAGKLLETWGQIKKVH